MDKNFFVKLYAMLAVYGIACFVIGVLTALYII